MYIFDTKREYLIRMFFFKIVWFVINNNNNIYIYIYIYGGWCL